ncbi:MAG: hypothetical protein KR126chlam2_00016 [Chlamydiae bacterium]|nr:hypothetical protein [Chlamydiota bacterium]
MSFYIPKACNNPLVSLPDEVKVHLCSFLSGLDLTQLASTCKVFEAFLKEEKVWRAATERTFEITSMPPKFDTWKTTNLSLTLEQLEYHSDKNESFSNAFWETTYFLINTKNAWALHSSYSPVIHRAEITNNKLFIPEAIKYSRGRVLRHANRQLKKSIFPIGFLTLLGLSIAVTRL